MISLIYCAMTAQLISIFVLSQKSVFLMTWLVQCLLFQVWKSGVWAGMVGGGGCNGSLFPPEFPHQENMSVQ